jgi:putative ABC transport system substrate-binding protein
LITRRQWLAIGGGVFVLPLFAVAQQKVWRVGILSLTKAPASIEGERFMGFVRGMRELGYVEGKNLSITWRFADNSNERMAAMAAELAQSQVDAIVTLGVPPTAAAKKVTTTIPIVMGTATDPLGAGLVASLGRPGGNITGLSNAAADITPKHLELLMAVLPKLARVGVLANSDTSSNATMVKGLAANAAAVKVAIASADARTPQQIDAAVAQLAHAGAQALIVLLSPLFNDYRAQIAQLSLKHRLPSVSGLWQYAEAGGLLTYGPNLAEHFHRAATYVDKIFKGAKPGELPIEQPTTFELSINRKTAQALRLTIPQEVMLRATTVIG